MSKLSSIAFAAQLLQAERFGADDVDVVEIGERPAPPQPLGLRERGGGNRARFRLPGERHELLETQGVELVALDAEAVARAFGRQPIAGRGARSLGFQAGPQPGQMHPQRRRRARRRIIRPEALDQDVARQDPVGLGEEQREQRAQSAPASEREGRPRLVDFERPENPELHARLRRRRLTTALSAGPHPCARMRPKRTPPASPQFFSGDVTGPA